MSILINSEKNRFKTKASNEESLIPVDMERIATIILGGGEGTRLFPLTSSRCKPAISFGGKYRLIDIPLSNSINSKCLKIFIITQFLSTSLHQHISKTYHPGNYNSGFIELLSVEQKPKNKNWFLGTADAVRQNLEYFVDIPVDYFLILSGDQLYNMNFQEMMRFAKTSDADLVVATIAIDKENAKRMGVLKTDSQHKIVDFVEKPQEEEVLKQFQHLSFPLMHQPMFLGSMGIYLFKKEALFKLLEIDSREDFGKHLIPTQVKNGKTFSFQYLGYWEDIGTISSYYHANIALTEQKTDLNLYDEKNPIFTTHQNLPGPKIFGTTVENSIISEGSIVHASHIFKSILGARTIIQEGTVIKESYIFGNDYYTPPNQAKKNAKPFQIGKNCLIHKAIIDKHVQIGNNVELNNKNQLETYNSDDIYIRDGIIIVTRGAIIPNGFQL